MAIDPLAAQSLLYSLHRSLSSLAVAAIEVIVKPDSQQRKTYLSIAKADLLKVAARFNGGKTHAEHLKIELKEILGNVHPDPKTLLEQAILKIQIVAERSKEFSRSLGRVLGLEDKVFRHLQEIQAEPGDTHERAEQFWNNFQTVETVFTVQAQNFHQMAEVLVDATKAGAKETNLLARLGRVRSKSIPSLELLVNRHFYNKSIQAIADAVAYLSAYVRALEYSEAQKAELKASQLKSADNIKQVKDKLIGFLSGPDKKAQILEKWKDEDLVSNLAAICEVRKWGDPKTPELEVAGKIIVASAKTQALDVYFRLSELVSNQVQLIQMIAGEALSHKDPIGYHLMNRTHIITDRLRVLYLAIEKVEGADVSHEMQKLTEDERNRQIDPLDARADLMMRFHDIELAGFIGNCTKAVEIATAQFQVLHTLWHAQP